MRRSNKYYGFRGDKIPMQYYLCYTHLPLKVEISHIKRWCNSYRDPMKIQNKLIETDDEYRIICTFIETNHRRVPITWLELIPKEEFYENNRTDYTHEYWDLD